MIDQEEKFLPHPTFPSQLIGTKGSVISTVFGGQRVKKIRTDSKTGYKTANMPPTPGRSVRQYLHRLVAEAHIPNPLGLEEVNHIDHDKSNCCVENLEWICHAENLAKARAFHGNWVTGEKICKPVIATPLAGGKPVRWNSVRAWAIASGNYRRAANVSTAIRTGRPAYGYRWSFDTKDTTPKENA